MKTGTIYRAYNKISSKCYIGQTYRTLKKRKREHFYKATYYGSECNYFYRALNKYDIEDWEWSVLEDNIKLEDLDTKEVEYIKEYNSYGGGYNSTPGGSIPPKKAELRRLYHDDYGYIEEEASYFESEFGISRSSVYNICTGAYIQLKGWSLYPIKQKSTKVIRTQIVFCLLIDGTTAISGTSKELKENYNLGTKVVSALKKKGKWRNYKYITQIEQDYIHDTYVDRSEYEKVYRKAYKARKKEESLIMSC